MIPTTQAEKLKQIKKRARAEDMKHSWTICSNDLFEIVNKKMQSYVCFQFLGCVLMVLVEIKEGESWSVLDICCVEVRTPNDNDGDVKWVIQKLWLKLHCYSYEEEVCLKEFSMISKRTYRSNTALLK
ncbi:hypothetical protein KHA80_08230 [Anaerobacillus sp. HL2]|nr:hypothetical protein KHA80_08230 [Anaerobacillus sp. HL2]